MKQIFLLLSLICSFHLARADYETTTLPELILKSAVIVRGTIQQVGQSDITITVQAQLKGKYTDSLLIISKFRDWTCAQRFAPYAPGQELLFFLEEQQGNYRILGAGDEGEVPIVNGKAYFKAFYMDTDEDAGEYEIYKKTFSGYVYKVSELEQAIRYYNQHHRAIKTSLHNNKKYNLRHLNNPALNRIIAALQE